MHMWPSLGELKCVSIRFYRGRELGRLEGCHSTLAE